MFNEQEFQAYAAMATKMIHGKETAAQVDEMLKSGDPQQTVPQTSVFLSQQAETAFKEGGRPLGLESLLAGSLVIAGELIEAGKAAGIFELTKEQALPLVEMSTKAVIQNGLKNKTIDPVELQEVMNGGLDEEMGAAGQDYAQQQGLPEDSNADSVVMERYAQQRMGQQGGMLGNGRV